MTTPTPLLSGVGFADDAVVRFVVDRCVGRPRLLVAGGALVGGVRAWSAGWGQSALVSEIAMRAAFSSTMAALRANAAVRAFRARLLTARG